MSSSRILHCRRAVPNSRILGYRPVQWLVNQYDRPCLRLVLEQQDLGTSPVPNPRGQSDGPPSSSDLREAQPVGLG